MGRRSLQASSAGINAIKKALKRKAAGQTYVAGVVGCSRQTIWSLLQGNPTDCDVFMQVCKELGLSWEEHVEADSSAELEQDSYGQIDDLVLSVREEIRSSIQERCGTMRVLDMEQSIGLSAIYTNVNILEKMTGRRRLALSELLERCNDVDFDRFGLADIQQKRVDGLEAVEQHDKLMVLGKPGAGKTTFLKRLAILCIEEVFQAKRVPVFITLKAFAEAPGQPTLFEYLPQSFEPHQKIERSLEVANKLQTILEAGQALILLDGLDEVRDTDNQRVIREIQKFAIQFNRNQFVMTCRIAAREYTFERFTEVEVADFDDDQIRDFVTKWFSTQNDSVKSEPFLEKLETDDRIRELATNPLLLTLLCLVFGEAADFPTNRSELYEEGLDVLLKKWDAKRNIERGSFASRSVRVYKKLSLQRKEDLLSHLAYTFFERGEYFFKQRVVVDRIIQFIRNAPNISQAEADLELDGAAVLKSIEAQHGLLIERARNIYSFSHLTFQEYFAARQIKEQRDDALLGDVVSHIAEKRWREVFRLTIEMLPDASQLLQLMKGEIDRLLMGDEKLQRFLVWLQEKSRSVNASYKPVAIRAFYLDLDLARDLDLALARDLDLALDRDLDLAHFLAFARDLDLALDLDLDLAHFLALARELDLNSQLKHKLQELKEELPVLSRHIRENFRHCWTANGQAWAEQLRQVIIQHRNIGHDWQFSEAQQEKLRQYYDANKLLVDCLNSDCYVNPKVRQEIEETLLLPFSASHTSEATAEIEKSTNSRELE